LDIAVNGAMATTFGTAIMASVIVLTTFVITIVVIVSVGVIRARDDVRSTSDEDLLLFTCLLGSSSTSS